MAAMSAQQLIQHLESKGLLPADLIRELRDSVSKTPDVSARQLVRWLVSNGHLSRFQGDELLSSSEPSPKPWESPAGSEGSQRGSGRKKERGAERGSKSADDLPVDD